ncbi:MAG: sn-glycerol-3-phosphate ABC transporter ATP-binding protein UgpC [Casimicrobium sp.]
MASLQLKKVVKDFGHGSTIAHVIRGVDLEVQDGEFVVFVGPSGCGKSTLLRMICGLEDISSGELTIDGVRANDIRAADRGLSMVFQSYALYPHMSVYQNMAFGLENTGNAKDVVKSKVDAAAKLLQLDTLLDRKPTQLSGGQRQRVAIGRSIVREPKIFLFDEPLSNLDAELRVSMRGEITDLHRRLGATMIYVTHDQVEAMTMADKIVVLRAGSVEQVGTPLELYNRPNNRFVAGFIGSPQMNFAPVSAGHGDTVVTEYGETFALKTESKPASGTALTLGVRPEHLTLTKLDGSLAMPMTITGVEQLGGHSLLYGTLPAASPNAVGPRITAQVAGQVATRIGETATVYAPPEACRLFEAGGNERAVR